MYNKKHQEENRRMAGRAEELLTDCGFNPADIPRGQWAQREYLRPIIGKAEVLLSDEFPGVSRDRIHKQISAARMRIHGRYKRQHARS